MQPLEKIYTDMNYAAEIRQSLDFNRYAKLIQALGNSLNDRKSRFDKSDIIEQSIETYSNGRFKWVDDIGRDHVDTETGHDLEFKYAQSSLYNHKGKPKATVKVKIKNSLGEHKGTNIDNPADYYVIGQQDAMAVISYEQLKPYLVAVPDGIEAHIPFEQLSVIFAPSDVKNSSAQCQVDYLKFKREAQRRLIESV